MTGQEDFMAAIHELERLARTQGDQLAMQEIMDYFSDMKLTEKQMDYICKYLEMQGVHIENRVPHGGDPEADDDQEREDPLDEEMVRIYKKEAAKAASLTRDQEYQLVYKLTAGDENARNLLIEANLSLAMELAEEYRGRGLPVSDLIQESNIGLMMAINQFEPEIDGSFSDYKESTIRQQIEAALNEYSHSTRSARKMASRVNELNALATAFAREYEREATPSELAERMGITEEEVRELMKVSLDAVAVLDQGKIGR
ncbi:MAG: sigma-70 family RNA polymerase sigma factor [Eubacterium sp.]|nr:sigma-70 family RNA polymerase sigma factor [Eubacterium sp.]